jgi:hypothetical protein
MQFESVSFATDEDGARGATKPSSAGHGAAQIWLWIEAT